MKKSEKKDGKVKVVKQEIPADALKAVSGGRRGSSRTTKSSSGDD